MAAACSSTCAVQPAWRGQREGRREQVRRQADALEHGGGVVLDVRLQRPVGMSLGEHPQRDVLDGDGELEPVGRAGHALGDLAQRGGARVVGAVDAVAEAHQPLAAVERVVDPRLGVLRRADLVELVDDLGRCAAMQRSLERADGARRSLSDVRLRVEVMTRAVNVEALKPCSAPTMK